MWVNVEKFELSLIRNCQDKRKYVEAICEYFSNLDNKKSEEIGTIEYLCIMCSLDYQSLVIITIVPK